MSSTTYSKKFNKAFVLSPNDLRYFYGEGKHFMENNVDGSFKTLLIGFMKNIDASLVREEPDSIIEYSNPRLNEIRAISILMVSEDEEHFFKLVFNNTLVDAPVYLTVGGKSPPEVEPCSLKLETELAERSQWYSFISNRVWSIKHRWILFVVFALLLVWGLASTFIRAQQLKRARAQVLATLNTYDDNLSDPNQAQVREKAKETLELLDKASSPIKIVKGVLIGVLLYFICHFIEKLIHYLFPRVVFEIGSGKKRHENIKKVRKIIGYWLMTLIIGIVLLIIATKL